MTSSALRLKDKVVIVTGGAQGIGRAYALGMSVEGARLVIADINLSAAQATSSDIIGQGGQALAIKTDVSSFESTQELAREANNHFGRIDVLVNNAAVFERNKMARVPFWELDPGEWDRAMSVNLKGTFLCCRAVFPYMRAQGGGKIINIASAAALVGSLNQLHYSSSKAGVLGMTKSLARELGEYDINVNCIAPGATQNWDSSDGAEFERRADVLQQLLPKRPMKRIELPEDIVGTAVFLASSDSDFVTGQTIVVDGGEIMH